MYKIIFAHGKICDLEQCVWIVCLSFTLVSTKAMVWVLLPKATGVVQNLAVCLSERATEPMEWGSKWRNLKIQWFMILKTLNWSLETPLATKCNAFTHTLVWSMLKKQACVLEWNMHFFSFLDYWKTQKMSAWPLAAPLVTMKLWINTVRNWFVLFSNAL